MCTCTADSFAIQQKLTQYYNVTILLKKKSKIGDLWFLNGLHTSQYD